MRFFIALLLFSCSAFGQDVLHPFPSDFEFVPDSDPYHRWLFLESQVDPVKPPKLLQPPPVKSGDNLNAFQTKYLTFQTQNLIDSLKESNKTVKTVDNFSKKPPKFEIMEVKNSIYYDVSSSKAIVKSEYGDNMLKESVSVLNACKETELSRLINKTSSLRTGIKYTDSGDENKTTILFVELNW